MSENSVSRREMLRAAAAAVAASGQLPAQSAQHVHQHAAAAKGGAAGVYKPKLFTPHEFKTLTALVALIIPADAGGPGAVEAGAPEFIDLLASHNKELSLIFTGGLGWLDAEMERRFQADFATATAVQRAELLDLISYRKNDSPQLAPGIRFFDWARRMTVDAYFTSEAGTRDLGFQGNSGQSVFQVPKQALDYALKRSPFAADA